jgi:HEPN domain-containing protein
VTANISKLQDYWFLGAKEALETANDIFVHAKRNSAALFYLHLAFEKLLKACYVKRSKEHAPYTHNLLVLAAKCDFELTQEEEDILGSVNDFNLSGRYPEIKDALFEKATHKYTLEQFEKVKPVWNSIMKKFDAIP